MAKSKIIIFVWVLAFFAVGDALQIRERLQNDDGETLQEAKPRRSRMTGAEIAESSEIEDYPWMAAIFYYIDNRWWTFGGDPLEVTTVHVRGLGTYIIELYASCTGFIAKADTVITSCHCLLNWDRKYLYGPEIQVKYAEYVRARAGSSSIEPNDFSGEVQLIASNFLTVHPDCIEKGIKWKRYDVGYLELKSSFRLGRAVGAFDVSKHLFARSFHVEEYAKALQDNLNCTTLGWGLTAPGGIRFYLRKARMRLATVEECQKVVNSLARHAYMLKFKIDNESMICVIPAPGRPCKGDEGAPLYCGPPRQHSSYPLLWGIASFNPNCSSLASPSIYTQMTEGIRWWLISTLKHGSELKYAYNYPFKTSTLMSLFPFRSDSVRFGPRLWTILMTSIISLAFVESRVGK